MKKLIRNIVIVVLFSFSAAWLAKIDNYWAQVGFIILSSIVGLAIGSLSDFIDKHNQSIATWVKAKVIYNNKELFLSFSYLYRIEIGGKYLLIRGKRLKKQYQPVGGVYQFYEQGRSYLESINALPGGDFVGSEESADLRLRIKGKYLLGFYDWFSQMKDREYDPTREFYEELIIQGYLDEKDFKHLRYRKVGVHNKGITKSLVPGRMPEVMYADIFEIILTDDQKEKISEAVRRHPNELYLADINEVLHRMTKDSVDMNISNSASWVLGGG